MLGSVSRSVQLSTVTYRLCFLVVIIFALEGSSLGVADSPESASEPSAPVPAERTNETQTIDGEAGAGRYKPGALVNDMISTFSFIE